MVGLTVWPGMPDSVQLGAQIKQWNEALSCQLTDVKIVILNTMTAVYFLRSVDTPVCNSGTCIADAVSIGI
jgi:hypothetical protein